MSEPAIDDLIDGKYKVVRHIGQGAWATVYEALNVRIRRRVAIKILHPDTSGRPDMQQRFIREAEAATRIESPFVVGVFDLGTLPDGRSYLVMELLDGEDLGKRLGKVGTLTEEEAARFGVHALTGLAEAHSNGVLHRDIKPDNLFIVRSKSGDEVVKIVDFGISKLGPRHAENLSITKTDVVLGSPVYMSPEQCRGTKHMDARSDLYSIGVVLFEAVTGKLPHSGDTFNELMFKIALEDAPDARTVKPDLDEDFAAILKRALARDVKDRYQTAEEFAEALAGWLESRGKDPRASKTSKVRVRTEAPAPETAPTERPPELVSSGTQAVPAPAPKPPVEEDLTSTVRVSKRTLAGAGIAAVLVAIGAGALLGMSTTKTADAPANMTTSAPEPPPPPTTTTAATAEAVADPVPPPAPSPSVEPASEATAAPSATAPRLVAVPGRKPAPVASQPAPSASVAAAPESAAAPAPSTAPAPAPSPSSKTTVEGRTVHTTF